MRRRQKSLRLTLFLGVICGAVPATAQVPTVTIVNRTPAGTVGNGPSYDGTMTPDGRYIAFRSFASDLVPGDTNGIADIFVYDRVAGTMERVSVASDGSQATVDPIYHEGTFRAPSISDDGRFVTFASDASGLAPGQQFTNTNYPLPNAFLHDRLTGETSRVGLRGDMAGFATGSSVKISGNGEIIVYCSVEGDNANRYLRLYDRLSGAYELVSQSTGGAPADNANGGLGCDNGGYALTPDGQYVAFLSSSSNLVDNDTNGAVDVFVRDRQARVTTRVSVGPSGVEAVGEVFGDGFCCPNRAPAISADGRYVAFVSSATNLLPVSYAVTNQYGHVFIHDRQLGLTTSFGLSPGEPSGNDGRDVSMSRDGRYLAFISQPSSDTANLDVYDRVSDQLQTLGSAAYLFGMSADSRFIVYQGAGFNEQVLVVDRDITAPVLTLPGTLTIDATGPLGAVATYSAIATDDFDPNPAVSCTPASGTTFAIGTTVVTCTATDASGHSTSGTFQVIVRVRATPTIVWSNPGDILFGTALTSAQLNATASVPGTFVYTPAAGTVLPAGAAQTLSVAFTPADEANYRPATATVAITVLKVTPTVTWPTPADIVYGTALGATLLNATASVPGTFVYTPAAGTILSAGAAQSLSVIFTPTDAANYASATRSVVINVAKATPVIFWATPADITAGTALSAAQLNATSPVPGVFTYAPPAGTVIPTGANQTLSATFGPTDLINYVPVVVTVQINVVSVIDAGFFTVLHSFVGTDGRFPQALVQDIDGTFFVTTLVGGLANQGTVFRMDPSGATSVLHDFAGFDGSQPGALVQGADGALYGLTQSGGLSNQGTVFRIDKSGALTTLHSFSGVDGSLPRTSLIRGTDGAFYGTTPGGGLLDAGTVFRITADGNFTTLYSFTGGLDGYEPLAALIEDGDGFFYGTTYSGGLNGIGTIFRIDGAGTLRTLHSFAGADGYLPSGRLAKSADGAFYGTTRYGGPTSNNTGTVFRMDAVGNVTTRHAFDGADGSLPVGGLLRGGDGAFYGTTREGGKFDRGTAFRMDATGTVTTLQAFAGANGENPDAELIQSQDGSIYGVAQSGGTGSAGVLFRILVSGSTELSVPAASGTFGGVALLSSTLLSAGTPLAGQTVRFSLNGAGVGTAISDAAGVATLPGVSLAGIAVGAYANATTVTFDGGSGYQASSASGDLTVAKATPVITWANPSAIPYGTALAPAQLNAAATIPGSFAYVPAAGTLLPPGTSSLSVTFTAADIADYTTASSTVTINVLNATLNVSVVLPNGGEKEFVGVPVSIQWSVPGTSATPTSFDVALSTNGGTTFANIGACTGLGAAARACTWTPTAASANALVRVTAHGSGTTTAVDGSDAAFTIANGPPAITVTAPNTAVTWAVGTAHAITWNHNLGLNAPVRLELSRDNGTTWSVIAASVPSTTATSGTFNWTVSGPATTTALVRATWFGGSASDVSNVPFVITAPTVTVTAPNTAVSWRAGDTHNITFAHNLGIGQVVNIDVSRDAGASWTAIAAFTTTSATSGTYPWVVTVPPTSQARIRATWAMDASVSDASDVNFTILDRITVTSPNTAANWRITSTQTISWNHNLGVGAPVNIDVSRDGGGIWTSIAAGVPSSGATTGSYVWTVTGPPSAQARVRVSSAMNATSSDASDVNFSLVNPTITLAAPNAGVTWQAGDTHNITFTHNMGVGQVVNIAVSRDSGATWAPLTAFTTTSATSGTYPWVVSGSPTTHARIRLSWTTDPTVADISNVDFTITPRITVSAPNTAVTWGAGSIRQVTWTHNLGIGSTVDIDFSGDAGASWTSLATGVANATATSGSWTGPMPATPTTQALIRVSPSSDPLDGDVSDVAFTLAAPVIAVTAPNTNVSWAIGSTHTIRWTHNLGNLESVNVEISRDGGATWTSIAAGLINSAVTSGTLDWQVSGPATTTARLRVTWTRNGAVQDMSDVNFRTQ